jgi:hypothetical protein
MRRYFDVLALLLLIGLWLVDVDRLIRVSLTFILVIVIGVVHVMGSTSDQHDDPA